MSAALLDGAGARRLIPGLATPHPLGGLLPALYAEDGFAQRLTSAFDEVLAPVLATLDNISAYVDPQLAPPDFLEWLAGWVGVALDETWPLERQRALVSEMVRMYGRRGTVEGLRDLLEIQTGAAVEIEENGGCTWSAVPGGALPGTPEPLLVVRVHADPSELARLDAIVAAAKPAHVPHRIEVVEP